MVLVTDFAIETNSLRKSYGRQPALTGLDMQVPGGSIFGFLGRNGAGKTTTIKLLMGILKPDAGSVRIFGTPLSSPSEGARLRQRIGFVTEDKELYSY